MKTSSIVVVFFLAVMGLWGAASLYYVAHAPAATATANAQGWYFEHHDAEACVPIDDISADLQRRVYYHTGPMHSPADLEQILRAAGGAARTDPTSDARIVDVQFSAGAIRLIYGEALCRQIMAGRKP